MNFGNHITEILLPKLADRVGVKCSKCASARWVPKGKPIVAMPLPKFGGGGGEFVAMPKMGGKKNSGC